MALSLSSFVAVFLPGLLVGSSSSYLFLWLWNMPVAFHDTDEREVAFSQTPRELEGDAGFVQRQSERRHVLDFKNGQGCSTSHLDSQPVPGGLYLLLFLVHSSPGAVDARNSIRETWLRDNRRQGKFVGRFVIGLAGMKADSLALLACESMKYADMLFLPDVQEPENLQDFSSSEKLLQSFIWAEEHANFRYIFKCTDSTYVVVDAILSELEGRRDSSKDYLWGFFSGGVQATREGPRGEKNWFLCTHYLPHPEGGGYVISRELVSILRTLGDDLEHYVHDDIALGVWLSPFNGIEHRHDVRFNTGSYSRGCNNVYLVIHKETAQSMRRKDSFRKRSGVLCETEYTAKPSYIYNWTVPSNRCCVRRSGIP